MVIPLRDETRAEVIDSVLGQLSDGIWENSGAMNKYWMFADVEGTDLVIDDEPFRDEKGWGRYGSTLKRTQNGFAGKNEKQIKDWFANKAKQVVKIWAEDESKDPKYIWNRANDDDIVDYMGGHKVRTITVADVYECYDFLKGRSGKKYGIAADPLPYEVECSTRRTATKYPRYVKSSNYGGNRRIYVYYIDDIDMPISLINAFIYDALQKYDASVDFGYNDSKCRSLGDNVSVGIIDTKKPISESKLRNIIQNETNIEILEIDIDQDVWF